MSYLCLAACFDDGADDRGEYGLYSWSLDGAERERGCVHTSLGPDVGCVRVRKPTRVISEPEQEARVSSRR